MTAHERTDSGMCIPYTVRSTPDKGLGVFAEAEVSAGSMVWRHIAGQYEVLDEGELIRELAKGSRADAVYLLTHIISIAEFPGYMVNIFDEGALLNHSAQPNVMRKYSAGLYPKLPIGSVLGVSNALIDDHFCLVAACDLAIGDELVMDYKAEPDDPEYYEAACKRYGVTWEWL